MVLKLPLVFNRVFDGAILILLFMNVFVLLILFYLLYRFIGGFLLPLYRTTRQMRQQFHDMNGRSNGSGANTTNTGSNSKDQPGNPKSRSSKVGEYIDFEEVK
ncbi:MAG: DUF4834 family protein [Bacteroidota bacterium]|nr:DUF4834 family protein [Bacteroidota bacterium]